MIKSYPKTITVRDKKYLDWLKTQPCANPRCNASWGTGINVVPAHSGGGMAIKGDDSQALPLCFFCHTEEHRGTMTFWKGIDRDRLVIEHRKRYRNATENNTT